MTDFLELRAEVLYAAKQQGIPADKIKFDWYTLSYPAMDQEPVRAKRDCDGNIVLHVAALMYDRPADPIREALDYLECFRAPPKTLYVRRQLLNGKAFTDWAKAQGFPTTLFDLHVTIAFSREPVDWKKFTPAQDNLEITGGARSIEALGQNGDAAVLSFESADLVKRWNEFIDGGASWDWPSYEPHVTISFKAEGVDLANVTPYDGTLVFGPEEFAEVNEDYKDTAVEREFDESKHPRDPGGQWTSGGGGDGDGGREAVEAAIGADLNHSNLFTLKAAIDRGAWNVSVKNVREYSGSKTTTIEVAPKIPSDWKAFTRPITETVEYYDPKNAAINSDGYISPKSDGDAALPKQGEPGVIYRGMSYEEYQASLASGEFKSIGDYNIGEQELGLTYFSSDPGQAASYAHGFAPWPYMAVPGKPAVIIAVADPGGHIVAPSRPTELGINKPIPTSALRAVYFGDPIIARSGKIDIIQNRGQPPHEGSRSSPSISVKWREEVKKKEFDEAKHPRGEGGKWTDSGGGDSGGDSEKTPAASADRGLPWPKNADPRNPAKTKDGEWRTFYRGIWGPDKNDPKHQGPESWTGDRAIARAYAEKPNDPIMAGEFTAGGGTMQPRVLEAELHSDKPFVITEKEIAISDMAERLRLDDEQAADLAADIDVGEAFERADPTFEAWQYADSATFNKILIDEGYDMIASPGSFVDPQTGKARTIEEMRVLDAKIVNRQDSATAAPGAKHDQGDFVRAWSENNEWDDLQHAARAVVSGTKLSEYVCYDCKGDDKTRYYRTKEALDTINASPKLKFPLYRGIVGGKYKVGDRFSESLTSWTKKKELAENFASGTYYDGPRKGEAGQVIALDIVKSVDAKGLSVSDHLSAKASKTLRNAAEYLTTGQYEVTAVKGINVTVRRVGPAVEKNLTREFDESKHPRGEGGKWTEGGGESDGEVSGSAIGHGYSKDATLKDGKIYTSNVYDAARALYENRPVVLDQPRTLSTLVEHLGKVGNEMKKQGKEAPNFNLCNVSIKGTNLFCADSKGVPRPEMPQLNEQQTLAFRDYLKAKGYKEVETTERSDFLRATQNELSGVRVARIAELLRSQTWPQEKRLVASDDNYILDGHHLWAAQIANDAEDGKLGDSKTDIARINIGITELLDEAKKFGASYEAENKRLRALREFDEGKHPRGQPENAGQFGSGGGGSDSETGSAKEQAPAANDPAAFGFSKKETAAFGSYINDSTDLNKYIRSGDKGNKEFDATIDAMNSALQKSSLSTETTLFRGMYHDAQVGKNPTARDLYKNAEKLIGKSVPLGGFQSTSYDEDVALEFTGGYNNPVVLEITVPAGTHAIDMQPFADNFAKQKEFMLGQGSFKIDSVERTGGRGAPVYVKGTYKENG